MQGHPARFTAQTPLYGVGNHKKVGLLLTVVEVGDVVDDHVDAGLRDVILAVEVRLLGEEARDGDGLRDDGAVVLQNRHLAERRVCRAVEEGSLLCGSSQKL